MLYSSNMKRTKDDIERLRAELKYDTEQIETLHSSNQKAAERIKAGAIDYLDYAALGYTIHNLFSIMENGCFRIAKFFENNLSESTWHKELLNRMRDRKSTRLNSSHIPLSRMPSSA